MSYEKVHTYFQEQNLADRILVHNESTATVELAAAAIGCKPAQIAKSISFKAKDGTALLIVTAGDAKIDNSKFKAQFGCKAKMLTPDEAILYTGHAVGGVCPFCCPEELAIYLDRSLQRFTTVYPAAGASNATAALNCDELFTLGKALAWIDVCKNWE